MIRIEGVEKRYGPVRAVAGLDLVVERGETVVLLGSNGSGKTTILRAVAGLHRPTAGRIWIDGRELSRDPVGVKSLFAYLPQRVRLPGLLTARELLEFYAGLGGASGERVSRALEFVNLTADADRLTREYSGGMVQRLGLAIIYLRHVPLLLLDEPTLNLDPTGVTRFREWIGELKERGTTILFTSHLLHESMRLADRVAVMSEGRLLRVQDVSGFRDRVIAATSVRVRVHRLTDEMIAAARAAGATADRRRENGYSFEAAPSLRQKVIRAIEDAGGLIEELHTEPPDWESLVESHLGEREPES